MRLFFKVTFAFIAFFSFAIVVYVSVQSHPVHFDGNRVALIDMVENNYIFRGNNPLVEKNGEHFLTRTEMTEHFNRVLTKKGLSPIDENYRLVSVSFLDLNEVFEAQREQSFFEDNDSNEHFLNFYLIQPSLILGKIGIPYISPLMAEKYHTWFTAKLWEIHGIASLKRSRPTIIYIHCNAGRDRTGLFVSNYKLLFGKHDNVENIRNDNITESGRHVREFYDGAIKDYCLYLKRKFHDTLDCA